MRFVTPLVALAIFAWESTARSDYYLGGGLDAGSVTTKSDEAGELDKKGSAFAGYLGLSLKPMDDAYFTLGLGTQFAQVDGSSDRRKQEVSARTALIQADFRMNFSGFEPGILLRNNSGKTSSLRAADKDKGVNVMNVGIELAYRWNQPDADWVAYVAATRDANVGDEVNTQALIGIQYWVKIGSAAEPPPPPPPPLPPPPPVEPTPPPPPPAPEKPTVLRFKPIIFLFEYNSEKLVAQSKQNAIDVGKILQAQADTWDSLEVSGHADAKGSVRRNQELSELRAKSVGDAMIEQGISASRITSKGYGSTMPLPGRAPDAAENRRVEIRVNGAKDFDAIVRSLKQFLIEE